MPAAAPSTAKPDTIQCFAPGSHVALSGEMLAFSATDLAATAQAYDPALHEAPLVVGHPSTDDPAYGWVQALAHAGGKLEARPHQVNPEFAAAVNSGAYKKVSCAFWAPDAPGNPVPGVYYLRHIGFLGGAAPGVQGLRTPTFAGSAEGVVEFSAWDDSSNASLWRLFREWVLGKWGQEEADRVTPAYLVESVERGARDAMAAELAAEGAAAGATPSPVPAFAAAPTPAAVATATPRSTTAVDKATADALQAENDLLKQQLKDQAAAGRKARLDAAHADAVAFADGLVAGAQLAVAERDLVVAALDALTLQSVDSGQALMFAQGDKQVALEPAVRTLLGQLPRRAELGRVAASASAGAAAAAASLTGNARQRTAAIAAMFPDLPSAGA